jgi:hypothetical protein
MQLPRNPDMKLRFFRRVFISFVATFAAVCPSLADEVDDELAQFSNADRDEIELMASKAYSWYTGTIDLSAHLPSGKVANYFGFAYFRVEANTGGTQGERSRVGGAFLSVLDAAQMQVILDAFEARRVLYDAVVAKRQEVAGALFDLRSGAFDLLGTLQLASEMGDLDGQVALIEAQAYAAVYHSLTAAQLATVQGLRNGSVPIATDPAVDDFLRQNYNGGDRGQINTMASKAFSWITAASTVEYSYQADGDFANLFGFAAFRIEDRAGQNRGGGLRGSAADLMLHTWTSGQRHVIYPVVEQQRSTITLADAKRLAARREPALPTNCSSVSTPAMRSWKKRVWRYSRPPRSRRRSRISAPRRYTTSSISGPSRDASRTCC